MGVFSGVSVLTEGHINHHQVVDVVAAAIDRSGEVLVCRRRPEKTAGWKWEFPGRKLESGGTDAEVLAPEIQEELGASIAMTSLLPQGDLGRL